LEEIQINPEWFDGKFCLDVGCGIGRWTYALSKLGAEVVAFDFSNTGIRLTKKSTKGYLLKADLLKMPFREKLFDFIISWGVLHHTPNTEISFRKLVPLLKENGIIFIAVYEWKNPFKLLVCDILRKIMSKFSKRTIWKFSYLLTNLARNKIIYSIGSTFMFFNRSQIDNYDCYSTPINHYHREEDVIEWFRENKLRNIKLTKPPHWKTHKNIIQRFFRGKNGGFIRIRGVK